MRTMRTKRIELESSAGSLTIERPTGSTTIRIDSIIRDPTPGSGEQTWKTWHVESRIDEDALYQIAWEVQLRCDGHRGTSSVIQDYYRELQRFTD